MKKKICKENKLSENKAISVASRMEAKGLEHKYCFEIIIILTLVSIIIGAIRLIYDCYKDNKEGLEKVKNPGIISRWRMRRLLKKYNLPKNKLFNVDKTVYEAIMEEGKTLTLEEYEQLLVEAKVK